MQAPPLLPYSFAPTTSAHIFNALKHINAMQNSYGQVEEMHKCMQYGGGRVYSQKAAVNDGKGTLASGGMWLQAKTLSCLRCYLSLRLVACFVPKVDNFPKMLNMLFPGSLTQI
eukprot:1159728-Pelagomonas_calceolata.AAC.2